MSGGEYVQLKWNSHHAAFLSNLSNLRDKQVLTDVMLSCEEQFYPAHRLVLSSCSSYFSRALEVTTCPQPVLMLHGIKQGTLEHLLMYMYEGQVTISRTLLPELLRAGRWLGVKGLEDTGDLPPNLADDSSASSAPQSVSQMAHLVTQIFSSMASSLGVGDSSSVDSLANVLVRACEKRAKADQLCVIQPANHAPETDDQLDTPTVLLTSNQVSQSTDIVLKVGQQPDPASHGADEQSSSNDCVEPDENFTFQPKVSHISSLSNIEEMGELETDEAESNTSEWQMDYIGEQDIKIVPPGFELEDQEDNILITEQFVENEIIEPSEQEISPIYKGAMASTVTKASLEPEQREREPEPTTSSSREMVLVLPRIEIQPPNEINVIHSNGEKNEGVDHGRSSPCLSEMSDGHSFEGWEEGNPEEAAVTANLKALQSLITEALLHREHNRATAHQKESNSAISPVKIDRNSLKCRKCHQKFRLRIELKQHMRRVHNREMVCGICNKSFKNQSSYERHASTHPVVDGSNLTYSQGVTNKITSINVEDLSVRATRKAVLHHSVIPPSLLRMGSGLSPQSLGLVKESTVSDNLASMGQHKSNDRTSLRQHKQTKHSRTFTCAVCKKTFSGLNKDIYLAHLSKHRKKTVKKKTVSTIKSTSTIFKCRYCPYKGLNHKMVNGHMRVHASELPFKKKVLSTIKTKTSKYVPCPYCPFRGHSKQVINGHVKIHFSDLPFRCHKCLFRSSTRPMLLMHIKKQHPDIAQLKRDGSEN